MKYRFFHFCVVFFFSPSFSCNQTSGIELLCEFKGMDLLQGLSARRRRIIKAETAFLQPGSCFREK